MHANGDEEDQQEPRDLDEAAVPFDARNTHVRGTQAHAEEEHEGSHENLFSSSTSASFGNSVYEDEDSRSSAGEESSSIGIEICQTVEEEEAEKYSVLSSDFKVLINESFNPKRDYCSTRAWNLLSDLALPETKRFLSRYIRHCANVAEQWLIRIIRLHSDTERPKETLRRLHSVLIPDNFEEEIVPCIENIILLVRKRRWKCSITKKYIDALCEHTMCPTFTYTQGITKSVGILHANAAREQSGDPFRLITKEVNITKDRSNDSCKLTHLLWKLELRLMALLYLDSCWVHDKTTVRQFPRLADSRVLYSVYREKECNRPILSMNIEQIRSAVSRLYTRWNDMSPSQDLCDYFRFIKDRICILSITSLCSTIQRKLNARKGTTSLTSRAFRGAQIPSSLDPLYAFGKFNGSNMRRIIEGVSKMSIYDLDADPTQKSKGSESTTKKGTVSTTQEQMEKQRMKHLHRRLLRKQKIRQQINSRMEEKTNVFDRLADTGDYRTEEEASGKRTSSMLGDTDDQPRIVTQTLRKLGKDDSSSSELDSDASLESDSLSNSSEEEEAPRHPSFARRFSNRKNAREESAREKVKKNKRRKKKKVSHHSSSNTAGMGSDAAGINSAVPKGVSADDDFFKYHSSGNERLYAHIGKDVKDQDICNEIVTHYIIASIKNKGGSKNHPSIASDYTGSLRDTFLSCLTTDTFLVKNESTGAQSVKCITRPNDCFTEESHAMICQIEQETKAWSMLEEISVPANNEQRDILHYKKYLTCAEAMPWKDPSCICPAIQADQDKLFYDCIMKLSFTGHEEDEYAMNVYATEFEKSKIENALKWCWAYSRGKRNQFIYKNLRDKLFAHFLHPGEVEVLLTVRKKTGASIIPSQIVSQFRQEELDRVEKILREMTTYDVMEQFALFNKFNIDKKNIASHQHGAYLFDKNCKAREESTSDISRASPAEHRMEERVTQIISNLQDFSLGNMLNAHHQRHFTFADKDTAREGLSCSSEQGEEESLMKLNHSVCPSAQQLKGMYIQNTKYRFLNPFFSVPWASPRGLAKLIRVLILECLNFFMKEQNPLLDARAVMFNPLMTLQLCNTDAFQSMVHRHRDILDDDREEEEYADVGTSSAAQAEERGPRESQEGDGMPRREDLLELLGTKDTSEEEEEEHEKEDGDFVERMYSFGPEFVEAMKVKFENTCEIFSESCPIVLQCMLGCFLWYPRQCIAMECIGADSLLGLHDWLFAMTRIMSQEFMRDLLVHECFLEESSQSTTWLIWSDPQSSDPLPVEGSNIQDYVDLYSSTRSTYIESKYTDGGIYYRHLLMLLSKTSRYGKKGMGSTKCRHLCTYVIKMCVMMFPHILESFSIHMQLPPEKRQSAPAGSAREDSTRPVDPTIRFVNNDTQVSEAEPVEGEDYSLLDQMEAIPSYFPKT